MYREGFKGQQTKKMIKATNYACLKSPANISQRAIKHKEIFCFRAISVTLVFTLVIYLIDKLDTGLEKKFFF